MTVHRSWAGRDPRFVYERPPASPCGTAAAYKRHIVNGETPCDDCRRALRDERRAYRAAERGEPITVTEEPDLSWHAQAACAGLTDLFYPHDSGDSARARAICRSCPVILDCARDHFDETYGIWFGTVRETRHRLRKTKTLCGTVVGWHQHQADGTHPCDRCTSAWTCSPREGTNAA